MIQKNIAVIGGGISSLSLALYMAQQIDLKQNMTKIKIFQKNYKVGGRIIAEQSPQDQQHRNFCADVGANYIDFQNQQQKKFIQSNLPKQLIHNFKPFSGKFLIYQNNKLEEPKTQKTRFYYQNGFNHMAYDWKNTIQKLKTINFSISHHQVQKIQKMKNSWKIQYKHQKKQDLNQAFDILIFGTPAPQSRQILLKSNLENTKSMIEQLGKIKYTKQLSVIFEVQSKSMENKDNQPYSILMKNQPLTFICFHKQKYPQNQRNIAVVQTNQQLTQKYANKISSEGKDIQMSHNQIQKQIAEQVWNLIPEEIKQKFNFVKKCLGVHYWPQSLIKPSSQIENREECLKMFNNELNKDLVNEFKQRNLYFTGDYLNNKSRVSGAMAVGIQVGQQIVKQHFEQAKNKSESK